jgi:hypothetical protein
MLAQTPHFHAIAPDTMYQYDRFTHAGILQPVLRTKNTDCCLLETAAEGCSCHHFRASHDRAD